MFFFNILNVFFKFGPSVEQNQNCNLKSELNSDCLIEIFENLDIDDLVTLSCMDDCFHQIIHDHVIHKKVIVLNHESKRNVELVFKLFGNRIKHVKYQGLLENFSVLLETIVQYCPEDVLQSIDLDLNWLVLHDFSVDSILVEAAMERLRKIKKISIIGLLNAGSTTFLTSFVQKLIENSKILRTVELKETDLFMNQTIFHCDQMLNVTELILTKANVSASDFIDFIHKKPNLKKFSNDETFTDQEIQRIGIAMSEHCNENINSFGDTNRLVLFPTHSLDDLRKRYNFLSEFKNLKSLTLTSVIESGYDLYYPLKHLSRRNSLEKLCVHQNVTSIMDLKKYISNSEKDRNFNVSTKLHRIEFIKRSFGWEGSSTSTFEFFTDYFGKIMRSAESVKLYGLQHTVFENHVVQWKEGHGQAKQIDLSIEQECIPKRSQSCCPSGSDDGLLQKKEISKEKSISLENQFRSSKIVNYLPKIWIRGYQTIDVVDISSLICYKLISNYFK